MLIEITNVNKSILNVKKRWFIKVFEKILNYIIFLNCYIFLVKIMQLNHLLLIPDGERRHARREFLTDLFRRSKSEFGNAIKSLSQE